MRPETLKDDYPNCFYTGLPLSFPSRIQRKNRGNNWSPFDATVEHLIPQSMFKERQHVLEGNKVLASRLVNGIIGAAPLSVKFELRDSFQNFVVFPAPREKKAEMVKGICWDILRSYTIHKGCPVWNWRATPKKVRNKALNRYRKLLSWEEIQLDVLHNNGRCTGYSNIQEAETHLKEVA